MGVCLMNVFYFTEPSQQKVLYSKATWVLLCGSSSVLPGEAGAGPV